MISLPVVTDDFDGQTAAIDQAIREAAAGFNFMFEAEAPKFEQIEVIPDLVYKLISHYTLRGFLCVYDGDRGRLRISWDHPNMSWLEQQQITRAIPEMIPNLGIAFRASLVYLSMTNGSDLRKHSDVTLQREISTGIKAAATLGNTQMVFGFPDVPAPAVTNLFKPTFDLLFSSGFLVSYEVNTNMFLLKWGANLNVSLTSGEVLEFALED